MIVLLPPSEAKVTRRRGAPIDWARLSLPELTAPRREVAAALAAVSGRPDAARVLQVPIGVRDQVEHNLRLEQAPTLPAGELYSGVLYDALDLSGMNPAARARATRRVLVSSALYGVLRLNDRVAPYRVSVCAHLPGSDALHAWWRPHLRAALGAGPERGLVVDCRSSTFAGMWSPLAAEGRWMRVRVPGASHDAKRVRGLVTRTLLRAGGEPRRPGDLADLLAPEFRVELGPAVRPGRPRDLLVLPQ